MTVAALGLIPRKEEADVIELDQPAHTIARVILLRHQPRAGFPNYCSACNKPWRRPGVASPYAGSVLGRFTLQWLASAELMTRRQKEQVAAMSSGARS